MRCFFAPVCSRPPPLSRTKRYDDLLKFNDDPKRSLLFPSFSSSTSTSNVVNISINIKYYHRRRPIDR